MLVLQVSLDRKGKSRIHARCGFLVGGIRAVVECVVAGAPFKQPQHHPSPRRTRSICRRISTSGRSLEQLRRQTLTRRAYFLAVACSANPRLSDVRGLTLPIWKAELAMSCLTSRYKKGPRMRALSGHKKTGARPVTVYRDASRTPQNWVVLLRSFTSVANCLTWTVYRVAKCTPSIRFHFLGAQKNRRAAGCESYRRIKGSSMHL